MKVRRGWLLTYDKALRKMIPFFVKVRSRDIIPDNPVDITAALTQTSERWRQERVEDSTDVTVYKYTADWDDTLDLNNEAVAGNRCHGFLNYYLYKDGRLRIEGMVRLSSTSSQVTTNGTLKNTYYEVYLPFAFPENNPMLRADWARGTLAESSISATVSNATISNIHLNPSLLNKTEYPFKLKVSVHTAITRAPLTEQSAFNDDISTMTGALPSSFAQYTGGYFPVAITYSGWWKPVPEIEVENAKNYDGTIAGVYKTTGMVNLLSKPDNLSGEIIRPLPSGSLVRNYGYYTEHSGVRWFLMNYPATNERGYIPESLLKKGS